MTRLTVWAVRLSCLYLVAGLTLGAALLTHKATGAFPGIWPFLSLHVQWLFFGWMVQLAMGVAYWILPKFGRERGNTTLATAAVILLNVGLVVATVGGFGWSWFLLTGVGLEFVSAILFALHAWPRVKSFGA